MEYLNFTKKENPKPFFYFLLAYCCLLFLRRRFLLCSCPAPAFAASITIMVVLFVLFFPLRLVSLYPHHVTVITTTTTTTLLRELLFVVAVAWVVVHCLWLNCMLCRLISCVGLTLFLWELSSVIHCIYLWVLMVIDDVLTVTI